MLPKLNLLIQKSFNFPPELTAYQCQNEAEDYVYYSFIPFSCFIKVPLLTRNNLGFWLSQNEQHGFFLLLFCGDFNFPDTLKKKIHSEDNIFQNTYPSVIHCLYMRSWLN